MLTDAHSGFVSVIKLATTTSVVDSGILDSLISRFQDEHEIKVYVIPVGSGEALKLGSGGDVDMVIAHSPQQEIQFMDKGYGIKRRKMMENDFLIIGPPDDPAECRNLRKSAEVLKKIYFGRYLFVSRSDNSGTHLKEMQLWEKAGISPEGEWYLEVGQGMGACLQIANEKSAYCLVDRGTYLSCQDDIALVIIHEGDPLLKNPYHIIQVHPKLTGKKDNTSTEVFFKWVTSERAKKLINRFGKNGKALFWAAG